VKRFNWTPLDAAGRAAALARPEQRRDPALQGAVRAIVEDVRDRGWPALAAHALRLDDALPRRIAVAEPAARARARLSPDQVGAMELAARNIRAFHEGSLPGRACGGDDAGPPGAQGLARHRPRRPLHSGRQDAAFLHPADARHSRAGRGRARAGGDTPPDHRDGGLDPVIALAAELCGIEAVWTGGGAQAIAALAFGAGDIPRVDKICGPGNAWVAEAKTLRSSSPAAPAIDMPAGPSELMVIADEGADPAIVAADLLSQAEHDASAQVLLVTPSPAWPTRWRRKSPPGRHPLPPRHRRSVARRAPGHRRRDLSQAVEIANLYAPEHLSLAVEDPTPLPPSATPARSSPAARRRDFGDYLAGSSHVLPTDGAARAWGGRLRLHFPESDQRADRHPASRRAIAAPAAALARLEALEAHARAADAARGATFPPPRQGRGRGWGLLPIGPIGIFNDTYIPNPSPKGEGLPRRPPRPPRDPRPRPVRHRRQRQ
jgi:histidinol dehydrogenase